LAHAVWGYPSDIRRIYWGLFAALVLLIAVAWLIRDFDWLLQIALWGGAVACVLFIGAVVKAYFHRSPHTLNATELYSGLAAIGCLIPSYLFLVQVAKGKKRA
jgi:hypothetical protein